jgi:hypothetical protein
MRDPDFFLFKYAPVTTGFSIVDIGYDDVIQHWINWKMGNQISLGWTAPISQVNCGLPEKLHMLLPLDCQKRLLTETSDGKIAMFSNFPHGDGSSEAAYLANEFKRERFRFVGVKGGKTGALEQIGSTQFDWTDYSTKTDHWVGHPFRNIAAHKESRWEWHENGEPFPWEEFETYKERRIKDRLTPAMVERYCRHFGIELFDPDYYAGRATLITMAPVQMLSNYDPDRKFPQVYPNL